MKTIKALNDTQHKYLLDKIKSDREKGHRKRRKAYKIVIINQDNE